MNAAHGAKRLVSYTVLVSISGLAVRDGSLNLISRSDIAYSRPATDRRCRKSANEGHDSCCLARARGPLHTYLYISYEYRVGPPQGTEGPEAMLKETKRRKDGILQGTKKKTHRCPRKCCGVRREVHPTQNLLEVVLRLHRRQSYWHTFAGCVP